MKERLVTLGLAAGALALFWFLMFPKPHTATMPPRPLASGSNGEGYFAASRWLMASGVPTLDLHRRFEYLGDKAVSARPTGNLLILTVPFAVALHPDEFTALDRWVSQGNTLLVLAALDDTPLWSAITTNFVPELQKLTRIRFTARQEPDTNPGNRPKTGRRLASTPAARQIELQASGRIGLLAGVIHLATVTPLPSTQWQAKAMDSAPVLELARRVDSADPVLWVKTSSQGAIVVSAYASLFTNDVIGKSDNARLLSNIISWSLQPGGRVIFDDAHQGAVDEYDAARFYADPRLHDSLWWLLGLWLAWVLVAQPLRASIPHAASLDESAMLRVTARFFASVLRPVASAQWLFDEFFDRLRHRHGLPQTSAPPWEWLASHAGVRSVALAQLRECYARTQAGQRVSLTQLQRILSQISGQTT
ncbi:MAG TPA: DUF4350 domain-containing protein [Steroidobacteraceae bacterium]